MAISRTHIILEKYQPGDPLGPTEKTNLTVVVYCTANTYDITFEGSDSPLSFLLPLLINLPTISWFLFLSILHLRHLSAQSRKKLMTGQQ